MLLGKYTDNVGKYIAFFLYSILGHVNSILMESFVSNPNLINIKTILTMSLSLYSLCGIGSEYKLR